MRIALIAAASFLALPALAQQPGVAVPGAQTNPDDVRVNQLIIYGDDRCPGSTDPNEVIVCAPLPDDDRYRIPPTLRNDPNAPANQSWANRAIELQYVGRSGTDSCSTTGAGGFTGCFVQLANQGRAERRSNDQVNWARMIEEARQARLSRIDAAAEEEEQEALRREAEAANRPN
ncbi:MAG TPA: hypothetical protein VLK25_09415 [Allosphingosinicella sp.]|nr:hypothetical protein [Allosphingosinicella sp.]